MIVSFAGSKTDVDVNNAVVLKETSSFSTLCTGEGVGAKLYIKGPVQV